MIKYANSSNELPGIIDVSNRKQTKFRQASLRMEKNASVKNLITETRMPVIKGQSKAFPTPQEHFEMADRWKNNFVMTQSQANNDIHKSRRELFDRPVQYVSGGLTNQNNLRRPMEVYHKITPVRSP